MSYAQDSGSKSASKSSSKKSKSSRSHKKSISKGKSKIAAETALDPAIPPEEIIKFSDEQIMLNNQAVDAGNAGDYKKAEQLLMAMLQGGEMNIIWGNLGSLYAKQGKCIEAKDAFERVWKSPKITEIPAETIEQGARQALEKLSEQCSAKVILKCSPADMTVTFDDGNAFPCTAAPQAVTPGKHIVLGKTSYGFNSITFHATAGETTSQTLEVIDYERIASDAGVSPEHLRQRSKTFKAVGYTFIGVGAAAAISGGVLVWDGHKHYQDKYDTYTKSPGTKGLYEAASEERKKTQKKYNAAYGLFAVGGAMLVTGVTLVVYDAVKIRPQINEFQPHASNFNLTLSPALSPEFSGLALSGQF